MSEKKLEKKETMTKALAIGLILAFAWGLFYENPRVPTRWNYYQTYGGTIAFYETYTTAYFFRIFSVIFWTMLVIAIVNIVARKNLFSKAEAALISMLVPVVPILWMHYTQGQDPAEVLTYSVAPYIKNWAGGAQGVWPLLGNFMGPKDTAVIDVVLKGNAPLNLAPWMPTILWVSATIVSFMLVFVCIGLLMQKVWIEDEGLSFPTAIIQMTMIDMTQREEGGRVSFLKNRYFLIGLAISFIWFGAANWTIVLPESWNVPYWGSWRSAAWQATLFKGGPYILPVWPLTQTIAAALPWVSLLINLTPWAIGLGMLNTIPNIVGLIVAMVIFEWILNPVLYAMGVLGTPPAYVDQLTVHLFVRGSGPFPEYMGASGGLLYMGMFSAMFLIPIWLNRERFAPILKALWRKPPAELDAASPLPYRTIWIILIVSGLAWWLLMVANSVHPWISLLLLVMLPIPLFGAVRVICETGGFWGTAAGQNNLTWNTVLVDFIKSWFPDLINNKPPIGPWTQVAASTMIALGLVGVLINGFTRDWGERAGWITLNMSKISGETKVNKRTVLTYFLGGAFALTIILMIIRVMDMYAIDYATSYFKDIFMLGSITQPIIVCCGTRRYGWNGWAGLIGGIPGATKYPFHAVSYLIIGFAVIALLYFLRGRFSWFIVGPAGFALGSFFGFALWTPFLVALIIKYLVTRVWGVEPLTKKVQPLFLGLLIGYMAFFVVGDMLGYISHMGLT